MGEKIITCLQKTPYVLCRFAYYNWDCEGANMSHNVYRAESAWLGLTTDERINIQLYEVLFSLHISVAFISSFLYNRSLTCSPSLIMQLKKFNITTNTNETKTVTVMGNVTAALNLPDIATSVRGNVSDAGNGTFVHTLEIKFDKVKNRKL